MRLACLSHAASVQAEPGSNSSINFLDSFHPDAVCGEVVSWKLSVVSKRLMLFAFALTDNRQLATDNFLETALHFQERGYPRNEFVQPLPTADLHPRMKMGVTALPVG